MKQDVIDNEWMEKWKVIIQQTGKSFFHDHIDTVSQNNANI